MSASDSIRLIKASIDGSEGEPKTAYYRLKAFLDLLQPPPVGP